MLTFGELVELVTFEAPAAVGAFLRARFVPTQAEVERTMERIGYASAVDERRFQQWLDLMMEREKASREWLQSAGEKLRARRAAHEKRMRAMG